MSESLPADGSPEINLAEVDPASVPLDQIDVTQPELWRKDSHWPYFARLRKEAPVHQCKVGEFAPYWSVTRYDDIVTVEKNPEIYSSEPNITVADPDPDSIAQNAGFITMDGERHTRHRKVVQPVSSPRNLKSLEPIVRKRAIEILEGLPVGETFDWVDRVSIELTTGMLATMFNFPWEDRRLLTYWSDMATAGDEQLAHMGKTEQDRQNGLRECLEYFTKLWNDRRDKPVESLDFVTALANSEKTRDISPTADPISYLGTLILLIVGGNDTTRNSISGGVLALNQNPGEYDKLRADPGLIPSLVNETIRWQTPLAHMRRTATQDTELRGQHIKQGDKVVMWYVSANRDEEAFPRGDEFLIDRDRIMEAKQHLSFGWGIHFCMGSRIAEMQLRVLWEEILGRFENIEVMGEPERVASSFVKGYHSLPVQVHPK